MVKIGKIQSSFYTGYIKNWDWFLVMLHEPKNWNIIFLSILLGAKKEKGQGVKLRTST